MIAGWASGLLVLIAAGAVALGIAAWIFGEVTHDSRPFKGDDE